MCIEYYVISWNCRTFIFCSYFSVWMLSMSALLYIEAKCSNQWKWNVCFIFYIIILFAIVTSRYTRFPILVCLSHGLRMIIIHLFWQFNIFGTLAAAMARSISFFRVHHVHNPIRLYRNVCHVAEAAAEWDWLREGQSETILLLLRIYLCSIYPFNFHLLL